MPIYLMYDTISALSALVNTSVWGIASVFIEKFIQGCWHSELNMA